MSEVLSADSALSTSELDMLRQQQEDILTHIRAFVQGDGLRLDLYGAEKELFRLVLTLGRAMLGEVMRGTAAAGPRMWLTHRDEHSHTTVSRTRPICRYSG